MDPQGGLNLRVGQDMEEFVVSSKVLARLPSEFRTMFRDGLLSQRTYTGYPWVIDLPDDDSKAFMVIMRACHMDGLPLVNKFYDHRRILKFLEVAYKYGLHNYICKYMRSWLFDATKLPFSRDLITETGDYREMIAIARQIGRSRLVHLGGQGTCLQERPASGWQ